MTNPLGEPKSPALNITKHLSSKLGLAPHISKVSRGAVIKHKAIPFAMPGSQAALLRRLFGGKSDGVPPAHS